jgi:hypothetical protein
MVVWWYGGTDMLVFDFFLVDVDLENENVLYTTLFHIR